MKTKNKNGFTLVEVLIVITLIAVLSTIGFLSYVSYMSSARDFKRVNDVSLIRTALSTYSKNHGGGMYYKPELSPSAGSGIVYSGTTANAISYQMDINNELAGILGISKTPVDPLTNNYYIYAISSQGLNYQIATLLESNDTKIAYNPVISKTYAAGCSDYEAYVEGNFIPKDLKNDIPGLVYSFDYKNSNLDISDPSNKKKVVLNKQSINLAYDKTGKPFSCSVSNDEIYDTEIPTNNSNLLKRNSCTVGASSILDGQNNIITLSGTALNSQIGWKYQICNNGNLLPSTSTYYYSCKNLGEGSDFDNECKWLGCKTGYTPNTDGTPGCMYEGSSVLLAYPNQGAFGMPKEGTLSWYPAKGGDDDYTVYISEDSALEGTPIPVGSNLKYNFSGLSEGKTYYWKVKTKSKVNPSKELVSETRSFTTVSTMTYSGSGGTTIIYNGSGAANTWTDPCPAGTVCRADDVFISYVGGNGVDYAKWNFGESRRTQDVLYGDFGTSVYKVDNKSDGTAKFKVKFSDYSSGTTSSGWAYMQQASSFDAFNSIDIGGGDGTKNLYMDLSEGCEQGTGGEIKVLARSMCNIKFYYRSDTTISARQSYGSGSLGVMKWYIENTDKLNSNWDSNNVWINGQGDKNVTYTTSSSPVTMIAKSLDFQVDLRITYDSTTSSGAGLLSSGLYSFGASTRDQDYNYGIENNLVYKLENKSKASAYFKVKTADNSSGTTSSTTLAYNVESLSVADSNVLNIGGDTRTNKNFYFKKTPDCVSDTKGYRVYPGKTCLITFVGRSDDIVSSRNNYTASDVNYAKFIFENTENNHASWRNVNNMNDEFTNSSSPVNLKIKGLDSYILDLLISYQSATGPSGAKHDFGYSAKDSTNFYGLDTKLVYTVANRKNGPAYFKLRLADVFSGTILGTGSQTWTGLNYTPALTSFNDSGVMDIGGEKILNSERWASNLYWEKSSECINDSLGYKINGNTTCTITFHGRADPNLALFTGSTTPIANFAIENTDPIYTPWGNVTNNNEYTIQSTPVTLKMGSSGFELPNLAFTYYSNNKESGETASDAGEGTFGTSTRSTSGTTIMPTDLAYWKSLTYKIKNTGNVETYFKIQLGGGDSYRLKKDLDYFDPKNQVPTDAASALSIFGSASNTLNIGSDTLNNYYYNNGDFSMANQCPLNSRGYKLNGQEECYITIFFRGDISVPGKFNNIFKVNFVPTQRLASNDTRQTPIYKFTGKTEGFTFYLTNYILSEAFGRIKLNLTVYGTVIEGYAYSETAGWICFDTSCGSTMNRDAVTGKVTGHIASEAMGWIDLIKDVYFNQNGTTSGYGVSEAAGWIKF